VLTWQCKHSGLVWFGSVPVFVPNDCCLPCSSLSSGKGPSGKEVTPSSHQSPPDKPSPFVRLELGTTTRLQLAAWKKEADNGVKTCKRSLRWTFDWQGRNFQYECHTSPNEDLRMLMTCCKTCTLFLRELDMVLLGPRGALESSA